MGYTKQDHINKFILVFIFISGAIIGGAIIGGATYLIMSYKIPKEIPPTPEQGIGIKFSSTNKDPGDTTFTPEPKISIKKDNKKLYIEQVLDTPTATHTSLVTLDRDKINKKNSIGIGAIYIDSTLTAKLYYQYDRYSFEVLGGYDIEDKKGVWGLGFGITILSW